MPIQIVLLVLREIRRPLGPLLRRNRSLCPPPTFRHIPMRQPSCRPALQTLVHDLLRVHPRTIHPHRHLSPLLQLKRLQRSQRPILIPRPNLRHDEKPPCDDESPARGHPPPIPLYIRVKHTPPQLKPKMSQGIRTARAPSGIANRRGDPSWPPSPSVGALPCGRLAGNGAGRRRPPQRAPPPTRAPQIRLPRRGCNRRGAPLWAPGGERGGATRDIRQLASSRRPASGRNRSAPSGIANRRGAPLWAPGGERGGATRDIRQLASSRRPASGRNRSAPSGIANRRGAPLWAPGGERGGATRDIRQLASSRRPASGRNRSAPSGIANRRGAPSWPPSPVGALPCGRLFSHPSPRPNRHNARRHATPPH